MFLDHGRVEQSGKIKAIGTDQEHSGLIIVEIPLNINPDRYWIKCLEKPTSMSPSVHPPKVYGKTIEFRTTEDRVVEDTKWILKYIVSANNCYEQMAKEIERKKQQEKQQNTDKQDVIDRINILLEEF